MELGQLAKLEFLFLDKNKLEGAIAYVYNVTGLHVRSQQTRSLPNV